MALKLLGGNVSPFVRKVRVFCAEKEIPYELEQVSPFDPPEGWREISPLGKIPALDHDGRIVNDSSVICAYLERLHPERPLYPAEPYAYARAVWFEEYADGGIVPVAGPGVFMPLVLRPLLARQAPDAAAVDAATKVVDEQLGPLLRYLDAQLADREFFVGDALTIADISVASPLVNLRHAGFPPDASRFPALAGFVERMHASPSFASCLEEETPIFGRRWA